MMPFLWCGSQVGHKYESDLHSYLKKESIPVCKWSKEIHTGTGILLMKYPDDYEQTISFLQLQVKNAGVRAGLWICCGSPVGLEEKLKLIGYGASHVWTKEETEDGPSVIAACLQKWITIDRLCNSPVVKSRLVGESAVFRQFLRQVVEVGFYSSCNVLLTGARGTGKEQVAHIIHDLDTRKQKAQLVILDCSTLKKELAESELFGHEKGAFTGADHTRDGMISQAHLGTLFLDEIGELPLHLQAELLRVIQEGNYKRVGSNNWRHSRFRLIAATNKNIQDKEEEFRQDLFDRIQQFHIRMPDLDQRKEDIPLLVRHFIKIGYGKEDLKIDPDLLAYLQERNYPGNIRELKNLLQRILTNYCGIGCITLGDIPKEELCHVGKQSGTENWFEQESLVQLLQSAIENGYNLDSIEEVVRSVSLRIATNLSTKSKDLSRLLGKSERWVQMQKVKGGKLS